MAKYATFIYGSGVLYGTSAIFDSIGPDSGPSDGGVDFTMLGSGFEYNTYDDTFELPMLDAVRWTDLSSGSGVVSTGSPHLALSTGATAGSVSGIESIQVYSNTQHETLVTLPKLIQYPVDTVKVFAYSLYVDALNYAEIYLSQGSSPNTLYLNCEVCVGGSTVDALIPISWTTGSSTFKILRWGGTVYFYANGSLVFRSSRFVSTDAYLRFYSANLTATYDATCVVSYVIHKTYVAFGNQIVAEPTIVSDNRIRGFTPPSLDAKGQSGAYKGLIDVSVVGANTFTRSNYYTYYYLDRLILLENNQSNVKVSIINDSTVRTPVLASRGLGGGK